MPMPTFNISISGSVLALYGAVLATVTATAQIVSFLRDRANVRVTYQRHMSIIGGSDPSYEGKLFTVVRAVNAGRRPVTLTNIGAYRLHPKNPFVCAHTVPTMPTELLEGKYVTAMVDEADDLDFEHIEAFEAYDAVGRTYRCNIAPWHRRTWSRMKRRWVRKNWKMAE
jgi:hypothetical protein